MYRSILKFVAGATLGLSAMQIASAADMPVKAYSPVAVAPMFSWTGCYVGVHVGGGWQASSFAGSGGGAVTSGIGAVGGGQIGCNYQIRQFVIGLEGELWGSSLYDRDAFRNEFNTQEATSRNRWDAAISVRSGVSFDRAFVYGKLGVVWGDFDYTNNGTFVFQAPGTTTASNSATFTGILIGVGFEYALTDNWTTKFEYNYIDYGNKLVDFTNTTCFVGGPCTTSSFSTTIKEIKQLAKVGLNYKF